MEAATASSETCLGRTTAGAPSTVLRFFYHYRDANLVVQTNDSLTGELLDTAFNPVACAAVAAPQFLAEISREDRAVRVRYGTADNAYSLAQHGEFGAAFCAVREVFARFCIDAARGLAVYGGYFAFASGGFALLGPTTVGKTILLLHLASRGARFCGDETLLLAGENEACAFPRLPSLREPGLALLPNAQMRAAVLESPHWRALPGGRLWYALDPAHLLGIAPSAQQHPLRAMLVLERGHGTPDIEALAPDETFRICLQRLYRKPGTLEELAVLRRRLRRVPGYRVRAGYPADTAALLVEVFGQCA